jgi:hypothetical protein
MSRFTPKRGIGRACELAGAMSRYARITLLYGRHYDRLKELRHERLDNALHGEGRRLLNLINNQTEA